MAIYGSVHRLSVPWVAIYGSVHRLSVPFLLDFRELDFRELTKNVTKKRLRKQWWPKELDFLMSELDMKKVPKKSPTPTAKSPTPLSRSVFS